MMFLFRKSIYLRISHKWIQFSLISIIRLLIKYFLYRKFSKNWCNLINIFLRLLFYTQNSFEFCLRIIQRMEFNKVLLLDIINQIWLSKVFEYDLSFFLLVFPCLYSIDNFSFTYYPFHTTKILFFNERIRGREESKTIQQYQNYLFCFYKEVVIIAI